jgi:hypothetical protein
MGLILVRVLLMDSSVLHPGVSRPVPERASEILTRLSHTELENIDVGTLLEALKDRSFGIILILFALPNAILPVAWVLGAPILLFSIQMTMGRQEPWLPALMKRPQLSRETFVKVMDYVSRYLAIIESWLKPRWHWLTTNRMERVIGAYLVFLTVVLLVPVPFGNALPSFGIAIIAAGLLEKDGAAIIVGAVVGLIGTVYILAVIGGALAAFKAIFAYFGFN